MSSFTFFAGRRGPAVCLTGQRPDVRPRPPIDRATVTRLLADKIPHCSRLSTGMTVTPGEVNRMRAGRGIVHCERKPRPRLQVFRFIRDLGAQGG